MLKFRAIEIAGVLHDLAILETALDAKINREGSSSLVEHITLREATLDAENAVFATKDDPDLRAATEHARRLASRLARPNRRLTSGELQIETQNLRESIVAELRRVTAISVPQLYADYVENTDLFGSDVKDAFPSALDDIREAGNCLAVGLHTATVFHLMRAVEIALRALARERRVALPKSGVDYATWEQVIRALESAVDASFKQWQKGPEKSEAVGFYRSAIAGFHAFKDVFRNHVMHARATYSAEDAQRAMEQVRSFYLSLASRLDERGRRIRWRRPR